MGTPVYKSGSQGASIKDIVLNVAHEAGDKILEFYGNKALSVNTKPDDSPVTEADLASSNIITERLEEHFSYPVLSEEKTVSYEQRKNWERYWLVDPLDGTRDFVARDDEFCINIALMQENKPVFGLIYVPVSGVAYIAAKGQGAFRVEQNGDEFPIKNTRSDEDLVAATSRFHSGKDIEKFCKERNVKEIFPCGSAVKFCRLAEGLVDLYPRLAPCSEWDIAAGHIICSEANCSIAEISSKSEPIYNKRNVKMEPFVAWRQGISVL